MFAVDVKVRLVGSGLKREGRLEVKHSGVWGTVCTYAFDETDADVVCHMLGFGYGHHIIIIIIIIIMFVYYKADKTPLIQ